MSTMEAVIKQTSETYLVRMWLNNDGELRDTALEILDDDDNNNTAAETLKEYIEFRTPLNETADLYTDLLNHALRQIDYVGLVESLRDN
jgi:hypothetical protein